MRLPFFLRSTLILLWCLSSSRGAHASHALGADLTYEYAGNSANPNQYRVVAHLFGDTYNNSISQVDDPTVRLTCGMNECGTALPGSFTVELLRTSQVLVNANCTGGGLLYRVTTLEDLVQLPPAHWTLSINLTNRRFAVVNVLASESQSIFVKAELDNSTGLVNSSPRFTTHRIVQLSGVQP